MKENKFASALSDNDLDLVVGGTGSNGRVASINGNECVGCEDCLRACPAGAISYDLVCFVNQSQCNGCGVCMDICPAMAIHMQ